MMNPRGWLVAEIDPKICKVADRGEEGENLLLI